jgi:ATP-binding cassette subfamily C protein
VLNGSKALTMGILANTATVVADIFLLSLMIAVLMVTSPIVAVTTTSLFGVLALVLHRKQAKSAFWLGTKASEISRELDKYVTELAFGFKVVSVKGQINSRLDKIKSINSDLARVNAKASFLPSIGKYIIELSLITSLLFIVALQFILFDAAKSIGILTIFFIAGSRIAPAILRVQQSFLNIRANSGTAKIAADFIKGMSNIKSDQKINQNEKQEKVLNSTFVPEIELHNVTFKYSENETFQLHEINFKIAKGSKIAFVGHSGSGKSTLVDLILGLLIPKSGYVRISGLDPEHAIARWPGSIGYLPQETILLQASLKENIIFGEHLMHESDAEIWKLLDLVKLKDKFDLMPNGLDTLLGEGNMSLSGGEKQRLGLARALYSKPSLLVLDEATSALDATTEEAVMKTIFELNSEFTVIMIAHRLSTVINSDEIYLFDGGKLIDTGTFKDLNSRSSIFMQLVNLMQLSEQKE